MKHIQMLLYKWLNEKEEVTKYEVDVFVMIQLRESLLLYSRLSNKELNINYVLKSFHSWFEDYDYIYKFDVHPIDEQIVDYYNKILPISKN